MTWFVCKLRKILISDIINKLSIKSLINDLVFWLIRIFKKENFEMEEEDGNLNLANYAVEKVILFQN